MKEDDAHTIYLQINNLVKQNTRRPSAVGNKYPDRDLLHRHIKNATASIAPGKTDFNNVVRFRRKTYILGASLIKGIRRKELNSKLNKCSTRFRRFIGATLKRMETYVKPVYDIATIFNMTTKRKTTANRVTTRSMHKMKPANYITEIKRLSPNPSHIPTLILRNSFETTPLLNSLRLPILLVKSFEDIISEFNEKFQKIDERFDQLQINFNNYTNTEKQTNLSVNLTNKEIEINETIPALISENAQILDKTVY